LDLKYTRGFSSIIKLKVAKASQVIDLTSAARIAYYFVENQERSKHALGSNL